MKHPDILIIGTGRSGTTTTARVLHERFGVCFGHSPDLLKEFRGETVYEDTRLKERLREVILGNISVSEWLYEFSQMHQRCRGLTGCKLLGFARLKAEDLIKLRPKLVIRTWRPREECVCSWIRYNKRGREWAEDYYDRTEARLDSTMRALLDSEISAMWLPFRNNPRWTDQELADMFHGGSGMLMQKEVCVARCPRDSRRGAAQIHGER